MELRLAGRMPAVSLNLRRRQLSRRLARRDGTQISIASMHGLTYTLQAARKDVVKHDGECPLDFIRTSTFQVLLNQQNLIQVASTLIAI